MGNNGPSAQINMTPLIDVLLVLLIIFMVIVPTKSVGLEARVPQDDKSASPSPADQRALVLTVFEGGDVSLNQERLPASQWPERLQGALVRREDRTVFLTAQADWNSAGWRRPSTYRGPWVLRKSA